MASTEEDEITKDDLMEKYNLTPSTLDQECTKKHILKIAKFIYWEKVGKHLIGAVSLKDVDKEGYDEDDKRQKMLDKWKQKCGYKTTYGVLIDAMLEEELSDEACAVCKLLEPARGKAAGEGASGVCDDGPETKPEGVPSPGCDKADGPDKVLMCYNDWMTTLPKDDKGEMPALWVEERKSLWKKKKINVRFMNPTPAWRNAKGEHINKAEILKIANEWHRCDTKVVPEFVECDSSSNIRIQFIEVGLSCSHVGNYEGEANDPTMRLNLAPLQWENDKPEWYKYTIRHEFGHALGMQHEHQRGDAPPMYDEESLKKFIRRNQPNLTEEELTQQIKTNWAKILRKPTSMGSEYDKESVMHYAMPQEVRPPNYQGPAFLPQELSKSDQKYIVKFYSENQGEGKPVVVAEGKPGYGGAEGEGKPVHGGAEGAQKDELEIVLVIGGKPEHAYGGEEVLAGEGQQGFFGEVESKPEHGRPEEMTCSVSKSGGEKAKAVLRVKMKDLWDEKSISVSFMNESSLFTNDKILQIANGLHEYDEIVPKFVHCSGKDSGDIRIKFEKGKSHSLVGRQAKSFEPTMWLDHEPKLGEGKISERMIQQEFGHALGLQHYSLQSSESTGGKKELEECMALIERQFLVDVYTEGRTGGKGRHEPTPTMSTSPPPKGTTKVKYKVKKSNRERQQSPDESRYVVTIKLSNDTPVEGTIENRAIRPKSGQWMDALQALQPNTSPAIVAHGDEPLRGSFDVVFPQNGKFTVSFDSSDHNCRVDGYSPTIDHEEGVLSATAKYMECKVHFKSVK